MNMYELCVLFEYILWLEFGLEKVLYNWWKLILFVLVFKLCDDVNWLVFVEKIIFDVLEMMKWFVVEYMCDVDIYYILNVIGFDEFDDDSDLDGID